LPGTDWSSRTLTRKSVSSQVLAPSAAARATAVATYRTYLETQANLLVANTTPFVAGDVVHFTPQLRHQVVNNSDTDFQMYSVWWDADMAQRFTERHEEGS